MTYNVKEPEKEEVKVAAIDFDGTLHHYLEWNGKEAVGDPIQKDIARRELHKLRSKGWRIVIWTSRSELDPVEEWLNEQAIPFDSINNNPFAPDNLLGCRKIHAHVYLDDRALKFEGDWNGIAEKIEKFEVWYRKNDEFSTAIAALNEAVDKAKEGASIVCDMESPPNTVQEVLSSAIDLHKLKSGRDNYNGNEIRFGEVMDALYPDGLTIKGKEDWIKYGIFHMMVAKILRLSNTVFRGETEDSAEKRFDNAMDSVVYSAMMAARLEK